MNRNKDWNKKQEQKRHNNTGKIYYRTTLEGTFKVLKVQKSRQY